MGITRRNFLMRVGQAGGFGAAFTVMQTLGLMPIPKAEAIGWDPSPGFGKETKVVILGGGIAGLVSAYEMGKLGYDCTVLEARSRPGGRNWTIRNGTTIEFTDGTKQTAAWQPDSYFNAGPARLPSSHRTMLGYCKELGVPLEVEVNTSRSALLVKDDAFGGKPIQQREAINDTRGHVSELLAKCVQQNALNQEMSADDRERMLAFLREYGDLGKDFTYKGSERAGVSRLPGAANVTEELRPPLDMHSLLNAEFWRGMLFEEMFDMQATMMQPVGGMDRIPYAFADKLGDVICFDSQVTEIRKTEKGVRVSYMLHGAPNVIEGDYCICALPLSILKSIPNDFSPRIKQAISEVSYDDAFKVAWESTRFWETDFNIYGGISYVFSGPVNLLWYPSAKLFSDTGVVISGYGVERMSDLSKLPNIQKKTDASRAAVERLHPGYGKLLRNPMYMNWGRIPYNLGSWVSRQSGGITGSATAGFYEGPYKELLEPDGPIVFAGDHCSHIVAWQEGAALSAHRALKLVGERVSAAKTS
jgi:monoamine oxidase